MYGTGKVMTWAEANAFDGPGNDGIVKSTGDLSFSLSLSLCLSVFVPLSVSLSPSLSPSLCVSLSLSLPLSLSLSYTYISPEQAESCGLGQ